nr:MAG TPA: hypothetical protein [Bacteriophage sp.]
MGYGWQCMSLSQQLMMLSPFLIGNDKVPVVWFGDINAGVKNEPAPILRNVCREMTVRGQAKPNKMHHFVYHGRQIFVCPLDKVFVLKVACVQTPVDTLLRLGKVGQCGVQGGNVAALCFLSACDTLHKGGQALNLGDHPPQIVHCGVTGGVPRICAKRVIHG